MPEGFPSPVARPHGPPGFVARGSHGNLRVFSFHNLLASVWVGPGVIETMDLVERTHDEHLGRCGGQMVSLTVIRGFSMRTVPDPAFRERGAALQRRVDDRVAGQVQVLEGGGFEAASIRALLSGIRLLSRTQSPSKVCADTGAALRWLSSLPGTHPQVGLCTDALADALAAVD